MSETDRISQAPPQRTSLNHAALREGGMELIRQLAKETWTDHNVHDPGITLLEAFTYAMTELGLRIQLDVADLLKSAEGGAPAGLVPAHRVLPCHPVTPEDLRKVLLDHHLVGDAWIVTAADSEVPFYEDPPNDPPFTYLPGTERLRPRGLFEVVLAFEERDWNSNTYTVQVESGGVPYTLDVALPHWDEDEATPFREGAAVANAVMLDPGTGVWRALEEPQSYFGRLRLDHTGPNGTVDLWVLLRITEALAHPALVTPGILDEARDALQSSEDGNLGEQFAQRVLDAYTAVRQVERYVAAWRNLCEEPVRLAAARVQEIAVGARIEVTGSTDLERLLAEIFLAVDRELSPPLRFHSLAEMRARGRGVEEIFRGPLLRHGFLDDEELLSLGRPSVLYTSDVLRLIMRLRRAGGGDLVAQENPSGRDILAVTELRLSNFVNNRPVTTGARDCLRLVETERYHPRLSLAKSRVTFVRDDVEVGYDAARVESLFLELRGQERATTLPDDPSPALPAALGEALPVADYYPFQNDLPRLYGVGEAGLPDSADVGRKARALQTKGYLLLFEQFLADLTAGLGQINRFFSADPEEQATYFTRPLFDLPGVDKLLKRFAPGDDWQAFVSDPRNPHRLALQQAAEDRGRFLDRRNRMLDHLLARHGEETVAWGQELHRWAQKELTEAGLPPGELADRLAERRQAVNALLIRSKAAFLFDLPELNAARLQAFGNSPQLESSLTPMERRIAHLTGIRSQLRRRLIVPTGDFFEIYDEVDDDGIIEKRWRLWELPGQSGAVLLSSVFHFEAASDAAAVAAAEESIARVLRRGTEEWSYQVSPAGPETFNFELRDPAGEVLALRAQPLPSREAARQAMAETLDHLYRLYSGEGLHLVEHLLLRPRRIGEPFLSLPTSETEKERDPYSQRLSLLLPSGSARDFALDPATAPRTPAPPHRFRDPEFRRHAERTIRQACPAHLLPTIYWVDCQAPETAASIASFEGFEERYFSWLESRLIPGATPAAVAAARVDLVESLNAIANE